MTPATSPSTPMPANDAERVNIALEVLTGRACADDADRRMLGLSNPEYWAPPDAIELLNNITKAAMLSAKQQRSNHAQIVEQYELPHDIVAAFMANISAKLAQPRRDFFELLRQLANIGPDQQEDFPESPWRRAMHKTLVKALEEQRNDAAVEFCIASWTSGLMDPDRVDAHRQQAARAMVSYGHADEMLRVTSRAVCRMEIMNRLNADPVKMLALRDRLQQRLQDGSWPTASTPPDMARSIISMVALERLQEAIKRPESENPKDGLLASYCEEIHENLPRSRP